MIDEHVFPLNNLQLQKSVIHCAVMQCLSNGFGPAARWNSAAIHRRKTEKGYLLACFSGLKMDFPQDQDY